MRPTDKSKVIMFDKKVAADEKPFQEQQQSNNKTLEFHIQNQRRQARIDNSILALMTQR
jgi:hypothetical protein